MCLEHLGNRPIRGKAQRRWRFWDEDVQVQP